MDKLIALLRVFQKGRAVANPAAWKLGQITANTIGALLVALAGLARSLGVPVEVSDDQALAIGGGVLAAVNVLLTVATSAKVGLPAVDQPPGETSTEGGPGGSAAGQNPYLSSIDGRSGP